MTAIKTTELTKKYGNKTALDSLNLTVNTGEIFSLLGTNGAGKTTAIKLLSTLIPPTSGSAEILGYDLINDRMKIKEFINVSPQETAIAPNLTVLENLRFMAGVYAMENSSDKIGELCEIFSLNEVLREKGKTLSGGWQRKLSIAISLLNNPKILFLDEPTLGLDVISRAELWKVITSLKEKTTIILTTHYMEEAEKLSDTVCVMDKGKLIDIDTVDSLKSKTNAPTLEEAFLSLLKGGTV